MAIALVIGASLTDTAVEKYGALRPVERFIMRFRSGHLLAGAGLLLLGSMTAPAYAQLLGGGSSGAADAPEMPSLTLDELTPMTDPRPARADVPPPPADAYVADAPATGKRKKTRAAQ